MNTVRFTDEELAIARQAVSAFLHTFSHDEHEMHVAIRRVLDRLAAAQPEGDPAATG